MLVNPYTNPLLLNQYYSGSFQQASMDQKTSGFTPNLNFLKTSIPFFQNIAGKSTQLLSEHQGIKKVKTEQPMMANQIMNFSHPMRDILLSKLSSQLTGSPMDSSQTIVNRSPQLVAQRAEMVNFELMSQNRINEYFDRIQKNDKLINELSRLVTLKQAKSRPSEPAKLPEKLIIQDEISTDNSPSTKSVSLSEKESPNLTGLKRKSDSLEEKILESEPTEIKTQKPIKFKRLSKKRSYVQKRKELKEIAEIESQLDALMKKNRKEVEVEEENLKDTKRRLNGLQKIKKITEKYEKIQDIDVREEVVVNFMKIENSREILVGSEYQAQIPALCREKRNASRQVRPAWSPDWIKIEQYNEYLNEIIDLLGCKEISEDKTLKLLMRSKMDKETALVSVRKNKTYYKNMLCPASRKYINELKKLS